MSKRTLYYGYGGNLVYDQRVGGSTYSYLYSYRKRLVGVQVGGSTVGTYGYDFTGARVWRQATGTPAVNSQYVYDTDGHLLAEHSGSTGAVIREYVWVDDMPLAVIDSSSGTAKTYYIHTGPVGEPLVMTDVNKNEVWNAYVEPFGLATVFGASSAALDLRLPGQWLTAETGGLNQNGFRDYDPTLGRYVEPDPVGLEAGQNVFPYVDGDPLDRIDPWGLAPDGKGGSVTINGPMLPLDGITIPFPSLPLPTLQSRLQNQVNNQCKPYPPQCRPGDSCISMASRMSQFNRCADARKQINDQCFAGGDKGHQQAYTRARQDAAICAGLLPTCGQH